MTTTLANAIGELEARTMIGSQSDRSLPCSVSWIQTLVRKHGLTMTEVNMGPGKPARLYDRKEVKAVIGRMSSRRSDGAKRAAASRSEFGNRLATLERKLGPGLDTIAVLLRQLGTAVRQNTETIAGQAEELEVLGKIASQVDGLYSSLTAAPEEDSPPEDVVHDLVDPSTV